MLAPRKAFELAQLAREHELTMYGAFGAFLEGWASAAGGAPGGGLADMRRAVDELRQQNVLLFDGLLKIALAEAEARAGDPDRSVAILDEAHSRYNLVLAACGDEQGQTVHRQLEEAFRRYGLPLAMLMGNGPPWGDPGGEPLTRFSVWLTRLGVRVRPRGRTRLLTALWCSDPYAVLARFDTEPLPVSFPEAPVKRGNRPRSP